MNPILRLCRGSTAHNARMAAAILPYIPYSQALLGVAGTLFCA